MQALATQAQGCFVSGFSYATVPVLHNTRLLHLQTLPIFHLLMPYSQKGMSS